MWLPLYLSDALGYPKIKTGKFRTKYLKLIAFLEIFVFFIVVECIIGCQGVVPLGGPDPWYNLGGPTKVEACKSFLFTESFLV